MANRTDFFRVYNATKKYPNSLGLKNGFKDEWIKLQREKFIEKNERKEAD